MNLKNIYKEMSTPLHVKAGMYVVVHWRNKNPSFPRKIATGIALASLGIAGLIDILARLALAILTAPAELAGYKFARSFAIGGIVGGAMSGLFLTIGQRENMRRKKL